jgi:hypothetical protein
VLLNALLTLPQLAFPRIRLPLILGQFTVQVQKLPFSACSFFLEKLQLLSQLWLAPLVILFPSLRRTMSIAKGIQLFVELLKLHLQGPHLLQQLFQPPLSLKLPIFGVPQLLFPVVSSLSGSLSFPLRLPQLLSKIKDCPLLYLDGLLQLLRFCFHPFALPSIALIPLSSSAFGLEDLELPLAEMGMSFHCLTLQPMRIVHLLSHCLKGLLFRVQQTLLGNGRLLCLMLQNATALLLHSRQAGKARLYTSHHYTMLLLLLLILVKANVLLVSLLIYMTTRLAFDLAPKEQ